MKIICLSKRRPLSRDLWERPYGRFYYLTLGLAKKGHLVHLVLANFKKESQFSKQRDGFVWHSVNVQPNPFHYYAYVKKLAEQEKPDWIIGYSDTYFGIMAVNIARHVNCQSLIDAYDNYESYMPWFKPLHWVWQRALRNASAITAAGPNLLTKLVKNRKLGNVTEKVIPMCADPLFCPKDKIASREQFNLPQDKFIIGYSGSIFASRDIDIFFKALYEIRLLSPNVINVFSGRMPVNVEFPSNTYWLGYIEDESMPHLLSCFDVAISMNKDSEFGNFSYPVKIYEALACNTPVLASMTMSTKYVLRHYSIALFSPGNVSALVAKLQEVIREPYQIQSTAESWDQHSSELHDFISILSQSNP